LSITDSRRIGGVQNKVNTKCESDHPKMIALRPAVETIWKRKEGGASRKVVMNPRPRENPAQSIG
jgi:hypothetical protein